MEKVKAVQTQTLVEELLEVVPTPKQEIEQLPSVLKEVLEQPKWEEMTIDERCKILAKDALLRIKDGTLTGKRGMLFHNSVERNDEGMIRVKFETKCTVCAVGGLMVAYAQRHNLSFTTMQHLFKNIPSEVFNNNSVIGYFDDKLDTSRYTATDRLKQFMEYVSEEGCTGFSVDDIKAWCNKKGVERI